MTILFLEGGWEDYLYWQACDQRMFKKVNVLFKECLRDPFSGIGKPEQLRFDMHGWWSRRIDREHRLVYKCEGDCIIVMQCRYHY